MERRCLTENIDKLSSMHPRDAWSWENAGSSADLQDLASRPEAERKIIDAFRPLYRAVADTILLAHLRRKFQDNQRPIIGPTTLDPVRHQFIRDNFALKMALKEADNDATPEDLFPRTLQLAQVITEQFDLGPQDIHWMFSPEQRHRQLRKYPAPSFQAITETNTEPAGLEDALEITAFLHAAAKTRTDPHYWVDQFKADSKRRLRQLKKRRPAEALGLQRPIQTITSLVITDSRPVAQVIGADGYLDQYLESLQTQELGAKAAIRAERDLIVKRAQKLAERPRLHPEDVILFHNEGLDLDLVDTMVPMNIDKIETEAGRKNALLILMTILNPEATYQLEQAQITQHDYLRAIHHIKVTAGRALQMRGQKNNSLLAEDKKANSVFPPQAALDIRRNLLTLGIRLAEIHDPLFPEAAAKTAIPSQIRPADREIKEAITVIAEKAIGITYGGGPVRDKPKELRNMELREILSAPKAGTGNDNLGQKQQKMLEEYPEQEFDKVDKTLRRVLDQTAGWLEPSQVLRIITAAKEAQDKLFLKENQKSQLIAPNLNTILTLLSLAETDRTKDRLVVEAVAKVLAEMALEPYRKAIREPVSLLATAATENSAAETTGKETKLQALFLATSGKPLTIDTERALDQYNRIPLTVMAALKTASEELRDKTMWEIYQGVRGTGGVFEACLDAQPGEGPDRENWSQLLAYIADQIAAYTPSGLRDVVKDEEEYEGHEEKGYQSVEHDIEPSLLEAHKQSNDGDPLDNDDNEKSGYIQVAVTEILRSIAAELRARTPLTVYGARTLAEGGQELRQLLKAMSESDDDKVYDRDQGDEEARGNTGTHLLGSDK